MTQEWYYLDRNGEEFGPFRTEKMQAWFKKDFFPLGDRLLVRLAEWQDHVAANTLYPDKESLFDGPPRQLNAPLPLADMHGASSRKRRRREAAPAAGGEHVPPSQAPPLHSVPAARSEYPHQKRGRRPSFDEAYGPPRPQPGAYYPLPDYGYAQPPHGYAAPPPGYPPHPGYPPSYSAPPPGYPAPPPGYPPHPGYPPSHSPPPPGYPAPPPGYGAPPPGYGPPPGASPPGYGAYMAPLPGYGPPPSGYGPLGALPSPTPGRYRGMIKSFSARHGFGFIDCPEARVRYGRDVFIHKALMAQANLDVGIEVTFTVETNKDGMPQARDVVRFDGTMPMPALMDGRKGESKGRKKRDANSKRKIKADAKAGAPPAKAEAEADNSAPDRGTEGETIEPAVTTSASDEKPEGRPGASEVSEAPAALGDTVVLSTSDMPKVDSSAAAATGTSNVPPVASDGVVESGAGGNEGDVAEEEAVDYEADES